MTTPATTIFGIASPGEIASAIAAGQASEADLALLGAVIEADETKDTALAEALQAKDPRRIAELLRDPKRGKELARIMGRLGQLKLGHWPSGVVTRFGEPDQAKAMVNAALVSAHTSRSRPAEVDANYYSASGGKKGTRIGPYIIRDDGFGIGSRVETPEEWFRLGEQEEGKKFFLKAIAYYRQAAGIFEKEGRWIEAGRSYYHEARLLLRTLGGDDASPVFEKAAGMFDRASRSEEADTMRRYQGTALNIDRAVVLVRNDKVQESLDLLRQVADTGDDMEYDVATLWVEGAGKLFMKEGKFDKAVLAFRMAKEIYQRRDDIQKAREAEKKEKECAKKIH